MHSLVMRGWSFHTWHTELSLDKLYVRPGDQIAVRFNIDQNFPILEPLRQITSSYEKYIYVVLIKQ